MVETSSVCGVKVASLSITMDGFWSVKGFLWGLSDPNSLNSGFYDLQSALCDFRAMMSDNVLTLTFLLPDAFPPGWKLDEISGWQGDRLSVLTPSALCLIECVCVCVFIACVRAHTALIRPQIPQCCNVAGVKFRLFKKSLRLNLCVSFKETVRLSVSVTISSVSRLFF